MGRLRAKLFSSRSWHCLHWKRLGKDKFWLEPKNRVNLPPFRVATAVMPRNRTLLYLNVTAGRPLKQFQ